ncbi:MAG: hypothetical protein WDN67_00880 [Candidatus Moraniibacteriota bacterium]
MIDAFNFLASQSGVSVKEMTINLVEEQQEELYLISQRPLTSVATQGPPVDPSVQIPSVLPTAAPSKPKMYQAKVTAVGDYNNLKAFLGRLGTMDRLHDQKTFSIGENIQVAEGETGPPRSIFRCGV